MKNSPISKNLLKKLYYKEKLSMQDISKECGISFPTVVYWMKKYDFPRRSCSDSAYCKLNPDGDPFDIKEKLNKNDKNLMLTGLMLYWAEGNKAFKGSIQLANLDHRMLQLFIKFLREICRVDKKRLRLYVRVYKKFNRNKAKQYWSKKLKMPLDKIFVYTHTDGRSKINKQWSPYGLATLQMHNLKFRDWLDSAIENHLTKMLAN